MPADPLLPSRRSALAALLLPLAGYGPAHARSIWRVGPGEAISRMADAIRLAADGDTIEVLAGDHQGDVAVITQRRLTIIGIGAQPVFEAGGRHAEGKAIWVVRNGDVQIDNIGFRGARVPSGNGAGIRFERGRLQLRHCSFTDNQMGLLSGNDPDSELHLTDCQFADAPRNPGSLPHLLYVGRIGRFSIRGSVLRQGNEGHLLKSRARESTIVGNRLDDGLGGRASYEIDLPNGGIALVERNMLVQSPLTENAVMLAYGAEGKAWDENRLVVRDNTFINHRAEGKAWDENRLVVRDNTFINHRAEGGSFVRVWAERLPAGTPVLSHGNWLLGPGSLALGPNGQSTDDRHGTLPASGPGTSPTGTSPGGTSPPGN